MRPKTWFITGASGGFGRAWAELVLKRGDRVAATARRPEAIADLTKSYPDRAAVLSSTATTWKETQRVNTSERRVDRQQKAEERLTVSTIPMTVANAYLVRGERPILVDTGAPGNAGKIIETIVDYGVQPEEISLILLTHGHADHFGNAAELRQVTGAPVAMHDLDARHVRTGRNPPLRATRLRAGVLKPFLPGSAPPVEPDILLRGETDLEQFGVRGRVFETPGHTAGSVSVSLPGGETIVGDVIMGGHLGGAFRPHVPRFHYFAEDKVRLRESIKEILDRSPTAIFVGHGGPLDPAAVGEKFAL